MPHSPTISPARAPHSFVLYAEVWIPDTLQGALTYGVDDATVGVGSVVCIHLGNRKESSLGLVIRVHHEQPTFSLKLAEPHSSGYRFSARYVATLDWCSRYYLCTPGQTLTVFWPAALEKYLDAMSGKGRVRKMALPPSPAIQDENPPPLTEEQSAALSQLTPLLDGSGFRGALLHGVTGSGKTRVYLELVRAALEKGIHCLVLVPEIGLTPQTRERFESFLGRKIIVLHSGLGAAEKRDAWTTLLKGEATLLLGTRSAILAPGIEPGLIILDEEHDTSFKQQDPAPRYHCREMAYHLAHRYGALVVLGSATPSAESWDNALKGHLRLLSLVQRATRTALPPVRVVDMKRVKGLQESGLLLSPTLREALSDTVALGQQAIVLHNRRGHSTSRVCDECGETLECEACKIPLVYHRQHGKLLCHYCGRLYRTDIPCRACGGTEFQFFGGGIEKVEQEIQEWIPGAKVLRIDRDVVARVGGAEKLFASFRAGEGNILLGTQMVAKGHDFPGVTLVGVISADTGSGVPDFRSSERLFQLLTQVSGRAGRALDGSRVILQTFRPQDPALKFALTHNFRGFAEWERHERQEAMYPPFCRLAEVGMSAREESVLQKAADRLAHLLQQVGNVEVLGPVDDFIPKINGRFRKNLLLKSGQAQRLRDALAQALSHPDYKGFARAVTTRIDIDP